MARLADPALALRRRRQILDAALACFRERGFRQTTIEEVCAEARVSPGALYRLFTSKADLIAAIAADARAGAEAALGELDNSDDLIAGLAQLAQSFLDRFSADGDGPLLADIWAEAARDPLTAKVLLAQDESMIRRIAAAIRNAQGRAQVYLSLPPEDVAEVLMRTLDGMALSRAIARNNQGEDDIRRFRALAVHLLKPKR